MARGRPRAASWIGAMASSLNSVSVAAGFSELGQIGQNCGILACHARLVAVCAAMSR